MVDRGFAELYNDRPLNSNVEVNGRDAFQLFPHGVMGYLLDKRRLNAKWYGPLADQLQFFFMKSNLLTPAHKTEMADLAHMIRQIHFMVRQPVLRGRGIEEYQEYLNEFLRKLVRYTEFHTPSGCNSIKYHCARHWGEHRRQLGCSPMEYSLERALGDHFTRFWGLTNHGQHGVGKDQQLAAIVHRHSIVADLCFHAKIENSMRQCVESNALPTVARLLRTTTAQLAGKPIPVLHDARTTYLYESQEAGAIIRHKIVLNAAGLRMPIVVSDTMRVPLQNRTVPKNSPGRVQVVTLRAKKKFFGKARYDNVKIIVECDPHPNGRTKDICYARCCAFFRDRVGDHFVAVHWYENALTTHFDPKARLQKLKPMPKQNLNSYDILPAASIINGALLVRDVGDVSARRTGNPHFWVRQPPREYNHLVHFYGLRPYVRAETQLRRDGRASTFSL
jgi:hypothetical protein